MSKEAVLTVLERAAEDTGFFSQLVQDHAITLKKYDLTTQGVVGIGSGGVRWIESHVEAPVEQKLMKRFFIHLLSRERW